ncbi:MAG: hypothetical protein A2X84_02465 [Desulfuromonadaceae bacterium GWC2_58_13]|nr:MAG: hypothetical protein A2X84_02465 [Desulfuromonadaceae bacterium GWC2_58_13]
MNRISVSFWLLLTSVALLSACNPTRLIGTWQAEDYQGGRYRKPLVLAVTDEGAVRRITEQNFVEQLRQQGVQALTSSGIFPTEEKMDKNDILAKISQFDVDALIVTRVVRRQKQAEQHTDFFGDTFYDQPWRYRNYDRYYRNYYDRSLRPDYYSDWYGYYSHSHQFSQARTYVVEYQIITAETNLYDARSGGLIWTGLAETTTYDDAVAAMKSYTRTMVEQLTKAGLI